MGKVPMTMKPRALRNRERPAAELSERLVPMAGTFISFRCSTTEISAPGGKPRLKRSEVRLEDGKLTSETFEGELRRDAFEPLMDQALQQFAQHTALLMRSLTWFLPPARKD
jgi:hypothetical protein